MPQIVHYRAQCTHIQSLNHAQRQLRLANSPPGMFSPELWASTGLLASARNWQLKADLGKQPNFLEHVTRGTLWTDSVLTSDCSKHVVNLEITMPWGDGMEDGHEHKKTQTDGPVQANRGELWGLYRAVPISAPRLSWEQRATGKKSQQEHFQSCKETDRGL